MPINPCPACWHANADDALTCSVCGTALHAPDTVRLPLDFHVKPSSDGALWLDDLGEPAAAPAPAPAPRPEPELTAAPVPPDDARAADLSQRAERRAAVRRDRRTAAPAPPHTAAGTPEVLLVGSPDAQDDTLRGLLQGFGFAVHTTADPVEALSRAASATLLASFVRAEMSDGNGGTGIDLCARLRQASAPTTRDHTPLLVLVAARLRPMDRVRAELAGCDDAIATPITRGSVAQLLDARGIRLPSDPRQA